MAIPRNLVAMIEVLRRCWPVGRTVADLARELDIQPWRVAELLGQCRSLGVPVEHVGPVAQIDPARLPLLADVLEFGLKTIRVGRSIVVFDRVSSTNDVAWQAARRADSDGLVVLAEEQTAGRGRFGRAWLSPPGGSLLFSLLLLGLPVGDEFANRMVMAASLAMAEAVRHVLDLPATIRWPNDLYLHGRKVGGILLESRAGKSGGAGQGPCADVVLGIGLNCNQLPHDLPAPIRQTAGSLAMETGRAVDRTALMRAALERLEARVVGDWESADAAAAARRLHEEYLSFLDHEARRVRIRRDGQTMEATVRDVDPLAGLIVELPAGGVAHFSPAQVSLEWIT